MSSTLKFGSESNKKKSKLLHDPKYLLARRLILVFLTLLTVTIGYLLISNLVNIIKDSGSEKVLTTKDLENPKVDLSPDTSSASVTNLNKELRAKIDKQINSKENPIDTVKQLSGVLSNTTNAQRKDQLTDFLEDFLSNRKDALLLDYQGDKPDQAQVNYWKGELYAYLVFNFKNMMDNQFMDSSGSLLDTKKDQLKYIDLYLNLANDPKSHIVITEENKEFTIDYKYSKTSEFIRLKDEINAV